MLTPIAIMSFNRPQFLAATLESLVAQADGGFDTREVHLFQDGAINRWSKVRYAAQSDIDASIGVFRTYFPRGHIHYDVDNIGICENFCRAEEHFFIKNSFPSAWFFEDDMVLSPVYFRMMSRLQKHAALTPSVAYYSAYGNYYADRDEVAANRRRVIALDHHWAFGLQRDAWLRMRRELDGYYTLVREQDYARRWHRGIYAYFARWQAVPRGSSQDAAKSWACARLGLLRLRTFAPFARYIGTQGAHMTQAKFDELGFAKTEILQEEITDLIFPTADDLTEILDDQRRLLFEIYRDELADIVATLPARKYNPMRPCMEADVTAAYRLLLNRAPEAEAVIEGHVRGTRVYSLVRGILRSHEYQNVIAGTAEAARGGLDPERICSEEELVAAYNLLLHRDPDGPSLETRVARNRTVAVVVRDLTASSEFYEITEKIQHPW